jgi:hypothetical protein
MTAMEDTNSKIGKIIWYSESLHYGWVRDEDTSVDYFMHCTSLPAGYLPAADDRITFVPAVRNNKPYARDIEKLTT